MRGSRVGTTNVKNTKHDMEPLIITITNMNPSSHARENRNTTVFNRVYSQLTERKMNPGKVIPLIIKINNDNRIFGAITLNSGGSVSFFPDFHRFQGFDHLTLNSDFIFKKGHATRIEQDGTRPKEIFFVASPLSNSPYYHLITFGMDDDTFLMNSPGFIKLPPIFCSTASEKNMYDDWAKQSCAGQAILEFPDEEGAYFIQVLILPKNSSTSGLAVVRSFVEKMTPPGSVSCEETFNCKKIDIPTPDKCDFSICVLCFRLRCGVNGTFSFLMSQDPDKPSSDIAKFV